MTQQNDGRWPRSLYSAGSEPDPRFSLANERTALAWIRTASSVIAGGLALAVYASANPGHAWVSIVAVAAFVAGAGLGVSAYFRWMHVERALRMQEPMPAPAFLLFSLLVVVPLLVVIGALAIGSFNA
jgi:putative membrane protein